eukprot:1142835-Pelagomonas_calceolata.AAC.1
MQAAIRSVSAHMQIVRTGFPAVENLKGIQFQAALGCGCGCGPTESSVFFSPSEFLQAMPGFGWLLGSPMMIDLSRLSENRETAPPLYTEEERSKEATHCMLTVAHIAAIIHANDDSGNLRDQVRWQVWRSKWTKTSVTVSASRFPSLLACTVMRSTTTQAGSFFIIVHGNRKGHRGFHRPAAQAFHDRHSTC